MGRRTLCLGIPTPTNQGIGIGALVLDTLLAWFVFGTVAHWLARWFGGAGTWKQTLGAMALSYAPLLLLVVEAVPGASVPLTLLFLAMLVGKYQAIKSAHGLTPGYTLASVLLPYLIGVVAAAGAGTLWGSVWPRADSICRPHRAHLQHALPASNAKHKGDSHHETSFAQLFQCAATALRGYSQPFEQTSMRHMH